MNIRNHLVEIQCNQRDVNDVAQALVHSIIFFRTHGKFNYKHEGSYSIGTLGFERAFCDHLDFNYVRCSSRTLATRINNKVQDFTERINENTQSGTMTLEFYQKRASRWPFNDTKLVWEQWNIRITLLPSSGQGHVSSPSSPHPPSSSSSLSQATSLPSKQQVQHSPSSPTDLYNENRRRLEQPLSQSRLEDLLSHKLLDIIKLVNSEKCSVPQMPTQPNLDTVFDTSHSDLQPYLYNISYKFNETPSIYQPNFGATGGGSGSTGSGGGTLGPAGGAAGDRGSGLKNHEGGGDGTTQSSFRKFLLGTLEL